MAKGATVTNPPAGGKATTEGDPAGAPAPVSFIRASMEHQEPFLDTSVAISAASTDVTGGPIDVPAYGYFRGIYLFVAATGGTGTAAVYKEDAPWSVIGNVSVLDVNGAPIVNLDGFGLYLANKWGGYAFFADPTASPFYVAATTAGNFAFALRIPIEVARRDGLASLPNQNASSTYKLRITQAATTAVYSTNPTGLPTVRWRAFIDAWAQPDSQGAGGVPNAVTPAAIGTTQFWTQTQITIASGQARPRLPRVGNLIRTLIFVFRDTTPARSTTNLPTDFQMEWDSHVVFNQSRELARELMYQRGGYALGAWDTGVIVVPFSHDFDGKPGDELRDLWVPTTQSTRLEALIGSYGASGSLTVYTNDVAPVGNVFLG